MHLLRSLFPCLFLCLPLLGFTQYYGVSSAGESSWSIGLKLGASRLNADVKSETGYQLGLYGQKTLGRAIDIRLEIHVGTVSGQDVNPSSNFRFNWALNGVQDSLHAYDSTQQVYHNFRMSYGDASLLFKVNLNRLLIPQGGENWDLYLLGGVGGQLYKTRINVYDDRTDAIYPYENITSTDPLEVKAELDQMLDNSFESPAQRDFLNQTQWGANTVNTMFVVGGGLRIRLSDQIAAGIESRYLFVGDDLLDGQQWAEDNLNSLDRDKLFSASLTVDYTF